MLSIRVVSVMSPLSCPEGAYFAISSVMGLHAGGSERFEFQVRDLFLKFLDLNVSQL